MMNNTSLDAIVNVKQLTFREVYKIRLPENHPCKGLNLEQILEKTDSIILAQIDRIWRRRNEIDKSVGLKELEFNDKSLRRILRWYLWELALEMAVRKERTLLLVITGNPGKNKHKKTKKLISKRKKLAKTLIIEGFKAGDRVTQRFGGKEGEIYMVQQDNCLVIYDDDPITTSGTKKTYNMPYHAIKKIDSKICKNIDIAACVSHTSSR
jgi:hypothetical protein